MDLGWLFGPGKEEGEDDPMLNTNSDGSLNQDDSVVVSSQFVVAGRSAVENGCSPMILSAALSSGPSPSDIRRNNVVFFELDELRFRLGEVLSRLINPLHSLSEEVEICAKLLSIHSTSVVEKFLEYCGQQMSSCMVVKKHMQSLNEHVTRERNFTEFRIACESSEAWLGVLDACNVAQCIAASCCLQHILQHLWTRAVHSNGGLDEPRASSANTSNSNDDNDDDDDDANDDILEDAGLLNHAGWCIKRARDDIKAMSSVVNVRLGADSSETIPVTKDIVYEMVESIGRDVDHGNDGYKFHVKEHFLPVFKMLHNKASIIIEHRIREHNKDAVQECFAKFARDNELRSLWRDCLNLEGTSALCYKAASLVILKSTVFYFLKSKQKALCKRIDVAPEKKSVALRQTLRRDKKGKKVKNDIAKIKESFNNSKKLESLLSDLGQHEKVEETVKKFTGKELTFMLKAMGKPSYGGKGKSILIPKFINAITSGNITITIDEEVNSQLCLDIFVVMTSAICSLKLQRTHPIRNSSAFKKLAQA